VEIFVSVLYTDSVRCYARDTVVGLLFGYCVTQLPV